MPGRLLPTSLVFYLFAYLLLLSPSSVSSSKLENCEWLTVTNQTIRWDFDILQTEQAQNHCINIPEDTKETIVLHLPRFTQSVSLSFTNSSDGIIQSIRSNNRELLLLRRFGGGKVRLRGEISNFTLSLQEFSLNSNLTIYHPSNSTEIFLQNSHPDWTETHLDLTASMNSFSLFTSDNSSENITIESGSYFEAFDHLHFDGGKTKDFLHILRVAGEFHLHGTMFDGPVLTCGDVVTTGEATLTLHTCLLTPPYLNLTVAGTVQMIGANSYGTFLEIRAENTAFASAAFYCPVCVIVSPVLKIFGSSTQGRGVDFVIPVLTVAITITIEGHSVDYEGVSLFTSTTLPTATITIEGTSQSSVGTAVSTCVVCTAADFTISGFSNSDDGVQVNVATFTVLLGGLRIYGESNTGGGVSLNTVTVVNALSLEIDGEGATGVTFLGLGVFTVTTNTNINGTGKPGLGNNYGVQFNPLYQFVSTLGMTVTGTGGDSPTATGNTGIIGNFGLVTTPALTMTGTGGEGSGDSHGIYIGSLTAPITVTIIMNGYARGITGANHGVFIELIILTVTYSLDIQGETNDGVGSSGILIMPDILLVSGGGANLVGTCNQGGSGSSGITLAGALSVVGPITANGRCYDCGANSYGILQSKSISGLPISFTATITGASDNVVGVAVFGPQTALASSIDIRADFGADSSCNNCVGIRVNPISILPPPLITTTNLNIETNSPIMDLAGPSADNYGVYLSGTYVLAGTLSISGTAVKGTASHGVLFDSSFTVTSVVVLTISGIAQNGIDSYGVYFADPASFNVATTTTITGEANSSNGGGVFISELEITTLSTAIISAVTSGSPSTGVLISTSLEVTGSTDLQIIAEIQSTGGSRGIVIENGASLTHDNLFSLTQLQVTSTSTGSDNIGVSVSGLIDARDLEITVTTTGSGSNNIGVKQLQSSSLISANSLLVDSEVINTPPGTGNHGIALHDGAVQINGDINLNGHAGSGTSSHGIELSLTILSSLTNIYINGFARTNTDTFDSYGIHIIDGTQTIRSLVGSIIFTGTSSSDVEFDIVCDNTYSDTSKIQGEIVFSNTLHTLNLQLGSGMYDVSILGGGIVVQNMILTNTGFARIVATPAQRRQEIGDQWIINGASQALLSGEFLIGGNYNIFPPVTLEDDTSVLGSGTFQSTIDSQVADPASLTVLGDGSSIVEFRGDIGATNPLQSIVTESSLSQVTFLDVVNLVSTITTQDYSAVAMHITANIDTLEFIGTQLTFTSRLVGSGTISVQGDSFFPGPVNHSFGDSCLLQGNSVIDGLLSNCNVEFTKVGSTLSGNGGTKDLYLDFRTVFDPVGCFNVSGELRMDSTTNFTVDIAGNTRCVNHDSVDVRGDLFLSGNLQVRLDPSYTPPLSTYHSIIEYTSLTNTIIPFNGLFNRAGFTVDSYYFVIDYQNQKRVTIHVNSPPVAINDSYIIAPNSDITISAENGLLVNDEDSDLRDLVRVTSIEPASVGAVPLSFSPEGSFSVTELPPNTTVSYRYNITDGHVSSTAFLTLVVPAVPSGTPTSSPSETSTATSSITSSQTLTATPTISDSKTSSVTPSSTSTPTRSLSGTPTTTISMSPTGTPTFTPTPSTTPTVSDSPTPSSSPIFPSDSSSPSHIPSAEGAVTDIPSQSPTPSRTRGIVTLSASASRTPGAGVIIDDDGDVVGVITLPEGQDGNLSVDLIGYQDGFPIVEVTLTDLFGNDINSFQDDVAICFSLQVEFELSNACLAFLDEFGRFVCEDKCLTKNGDGDVCGNTDHFTSFAILLAPGVGDDCSESALSYLYLYLTIAAMASACCIIIFFMILIEISIRKRVHMNSKETNPQVIVVT